MDKSFKIPPKSKAHLTETKKLPEILKGLIGSDFKLTGKTRTDGSNLRKLIARELFKNDLPEGVSESEFEIVPPRKKGVPKILRELIDTYIVTSGKSYNMQVWNRIPNCKTVLVKYDSGEALKCDDIRYVFVRIDALNSIISAIVVLTPDYIETHFGKFGKPTIKHQLMISNKARNQIYNLRCSIFDCHDES
jgi:hypothetical protein